MRAVFLLFAFWAFPGSQPCTAQATAADPPDEPSEAEAAGEATGDETPEEADPCRPGAGGAAWLDIVRHGIFRTVCTSARWFDGFFGVTRFDEEARETWGRLGIDTVYDEHDSFDVDVHFRAEVDFPNLDHRVNAFLGREIEEDFVSGRTEVLESRPELFRDTDDRDWLVGLGYRPVHGHPDERIDFQVGVKVRFPLEPFVQGRFRRYWFLSDTRLVRFRNIAFWRNQRGFGDTVTVDVEQILGRPLLLRWATSATFSETTEGVDWYSGLTFYQSAGELRALAYTAYVEGETDEVSAKRYGLRAVYRQRLFREWFFGQLIGGVNFPRELGQDRETSWELGVGVELRYGRHPRDD